MKSYITFTPHMSSKHTAIARRSVIYEEEKEKHYGMEGKMNLIQYKS
jgi:hypothetical protein